MEWLKSNVKPMYCIIKYIHLQWPFIPLSHTDIYCNQVHSQGNGNDCDETATFMNNFTLPCLTCKEGLSAQMGMRVDNGYGRTAGYNVIHFCMCQGSLGTRLFNSTFKCLHYIQQDVCLFTSFFIRIYA